MNARKGLFFRRDDDGPEKGKSLDVRRIGGKDKFTVAVASVAVAGYWSHWTGSYTTGCTGRENGCVACADFLPERWHGFLHVCDVKGSRGIFLDLTKDGKDNLTAALPEEQPLRGSVLLVWREHSSDKRPLCFEWMRNVAEGVILPEPADAALLVARIWGHRKVH